MDRYFLTFPGEEEKEVTVEEFVRAERMAGFRGPGHYSNPVSPATAGFSDGNISGRTRYEASKR